MNCRISESAAVRLQDILRQQEDKTLKFRIFVAYASENETQYGLGLDAQKENDELVVTKAGIEVLMEKKEKFLSGVEIDYNPSEDRWIVTKRLQLEF